MTNSTTPTVTVAVRPGTSADCDFLADAHRLGHQAVVDARGGELDILLRGRAEPIEASFGADIDSPNHYVLVATADDLPSGYLVAEEIELRSGDTLFRVVDLWVHPSTRGIGLGSALLNNALEIAGSRGCRGIDARALPGDRITKNFFESFGLVARTIEVFRSLEETN